MVLSAPPPPPDTLCAETVTYDRVRVVIVPAGVGHYDVDVNDGAGVAAHHAVERVIVNNAKLRLEDTIWFVDAKVDIGLPVGAHGDTAWVWL